MKRTGENSEELLKQGNGPAARPLLLTEADVARCLDYESLVPLMRETLGRFSRGEAVQPVRGNIAIRPAGGYYGVMPAHLPATGGGSFGLKSVSFFPGNAELGLHTHLATILLLDGATGGLVAILDGRLITEMRTAAVSAVSVMLLARPESGPVAILGAGVQARSHLAAIGAVRPLGEVRIWSRNRARAEALAAEGAAPGMVVCDSVREAVRDAGIVVTVTAATEPILEAAWLEPGAHLCVVGSSHPRHREVDSATVIASRVFVDSRESAAVEAGDLLIPQSEGAWRLERIAGELGDVVNGTVQGRESAAQLTMFKSLGIGVEDIASAALVLERARKQGLGVGMEL